MSAPRLLFYIKRNLHLPHVEPILRWMLANRSDCDARITAPPYQPSTERQPGVGLTPDEVADVRQRGLTWIDYDEVDSWRPEATIMADADYTGIGWGGKLVNVNHGLISKGWYYTSRPGVKRENVGSLVCVPGPYHAEVIAPQLTIPVVATGLVKFDPVGQGKLTEARARADLGLPQDAPVITFAPTFNPELSGVPVIADRLRELARKGRHVVIKLHGMAADAWKEMYRLLALLEERLHYVDSTDLTPSLVAADVVISDVSSAFMEAIALDRPVVLVDNPLQTHYVNYDPNDIEYRWRDVGKRARTMDEVHTAVDHCLANPGDRADRRAHYGRQLVGPIDGRASERAAQAILTLVGADKAVTA